MSSPITRVRAENGAGTMLGLGLIFATLGATSVAGVVLHGGFLQQRLQVAAESAAMAASDALNGYSTGYPCEVARKIIDIDMFKLEECRIVGFDAFIRVSAQSLGMVHFASARATNVMVAES